MQCRDSAVQRTGKPIRNLPGLAVPRRSGGFGFGGPQAMSSSRQLSGSWSPAPRDVHVVHHTSHVAVPPMLWGSPPVVVSAGSGSSVVAPILLYGGFAALMARSMVRTFRHGRSGGGPAQLSGR